MLARFQLADLVAPQSIHDFIQTTYAQGWAHRQGEPGRFCSLADWETVNALLSTQRFDSPRFRLGRQGEIVSAENFTEQITTRENARYRQVLLDGLLRELRNGATLIIDRVDQAHRPIGELATAIESELRARVSVNMYASWTYVPGFDTHWDDHDVFVIQLHGRKHWRILEPTRPWPLSLDIVDNPEPEASPVAEFDLTAGDVLYLPHGWWHSVNAVGEPSLHLTIGVTPDNGIDFMTWLVDQARKEVLFRRRLPRFYSHEDRKNYLAAIRAHWNELMTKDDLLNRFFAHSDSTSQGRPLFGLPDIWETNTVLDRRDSKIALVAPRATITPTEDGFILAALGRRWSFPSLAKPLIDAILSNDIITVGQVVESVRGLTQEQSANVILALLKAGVIALR
jgi:hypothetical protein